ncbi:hypothetical protein F5Y10DRAFT_248937 [Nemania abortiva]|nr:hypothetical protein F5Y10DRAFT_248937 [Nemania abortiva]
MRSYNQAASSMEDAVFLTPNNQRSSKPQPSYQPPVTTVRVNGVDFEMMSSTVLAPPSRTATPTPKPAPVPTSPTERGRGKKTPAPQSRSRSPSPGYGALWQPEPLRERKPSILERAHARLERSLHEHLVKAGRRPQPSFKVHSVRKSPSMGYREAPVREQEREKDPSPVPDSTPWPTEDPWIKRMEKLARSPTPARSEEGGDGDMQAVALDPQQDKERENNGDYGSSMESHFLYKGRRRDGSEASQLISTRSSSDSLFLGREDSGMHNPARHSFFLSEYAQRQIAAGAETDKIAGRQQQHPSAEPQRQPESQTQLPRVQSADSLHRRGRDEEAGSHRDRHTKLSREQLEFASLPSAMGELWEPFPFDDRRNLPSQTRHSDEIERRT